MKAFQRSLLLVLLLAGCDANNTSDHEPEVVVESYLVASESLPQLRLTWTTAISSRYDPVASAIRDASVTVHLMDEAGNTDASFAYVHDASDPGVYYPVDLHRVVPERTYRLEASVPGAPSSVSAETTVPGEFQITGVTADTVVYQGETRYEVDVTPSATGRGQSIYVFSIQSLEPDLANLTPFYLDTIYDINAGESYDPDSLDYSEIESFLISASPPLNEANYLKNPDGTVRVRLPWFALVFYGRHRVSTNAIDDAIYDFMRFQQVQQGGSTLSPGEIPNVLDHVTGGRGVFGSMASVSSEVVVLRE